MENARPHKSHIQHNPTEDNRYKDGLTQEQQVLRDALTKQLGTLPEEQGVDLLLEHCYVLVGWHDMTRNDVLGWYWTIRPRQVISADGEGQPAGCSPT